MKKINLKYYFILIFLPLFIGQGFAQEKKDKIELIHANTAEYDKYYNSEVQRVKGNVIFKQKETYLYCDSAWFFETANRVEAYGKVHIKASDTLNIFGDTAIYDGDKRISEIVGNAKMVDNQMVLTTDRITYEMDEKFAYYLTGGKIVDQENTLTSEKGYYYTEKKEFFFKDSVVLDNKQYVMNSDSLMYNTITEVANFHGPTTIVGDSNFIYCTNGWYDTKRDISQFMGNPYMISNETKLAGDTLYYDRNIGYGKAIENVSVLDTAQSVFVTGGWGDYDEILGYYTVTDSAVLMQYSENDTLFLHADTLKAKADSMKNTELLLAYHKVKFYRFDLQGVCDSLTYNFNDSLLRMYYEPALWADSSQLTADSIHLLIFENKMDKLFMFGSSLIVNRDDTASYNQIKGIDMIGYFKENELSRIDVFGNAETIYFVREDNGALIGINKAISEDLRMYVSEAKIKKIVFYSDADATLFPDKELPSEERFLEVFKWLVEHRPMDKYDIFTKEEVSREIPQEDIEVEE